MDDNLHFSSFLTSNGIYRSESGSLVNKGQPDEYILVEGQYSYLDSKDQLIVINYQADLNGYHITPDDPSSVS